MKKLVLFLAMMTLFFTTTSIADAHPGRLDKNGGHNCSEKSKAKGLCTGYHYHNGNGGGGSSSGGQSNYTQPTTAIQAPALTKVAVYLNNVKQSYTPSAYMKNGTTLVPMKPIFEALGATVSYDSATKKVTATKNSKKIVIGVGNKTAYVDANGTTSTISLSHPAEVYQGTTMVPLRFVSQALGAEVTFDEAKLTVYITTK
ncbi:copper amine oxidase N-terminal domain-containing protein [Lysinibacillus fusiformis]|uniref:copper amine oxidase N-terminal domain-containing protein n=1 Tax=Lysinibacillus fusiformis TaxID=28031 RepID=UPI0018819454|nr:copper amine oxidase N-terminal domain-containing protein [Lysinibacillus fusiformis]MBD8520855.1 copper amine oxidase N-terminal domain-containing protein [Lysinibacillus fusiformis]